MNHDHAPSLATRFSTFVESQIRLGPALARRTNHAKVRRTEPFAGYAPWQVAYPQTNPHQLSFTVQYSWSSQGGGLRLESGDYRSVYWVYRGYDNLLTWDEPNSPGSALAYITGKKEPYQRSAGVIVHDGPHKMVVRDSELHDLGRMLVVHHI